MNADQLLEQFFDEIGVKHWRHGSHGLYYEIEGPNAKFVVDPTPEEDYYRKPFIKGDVVITLRPLEEHHDARWEQVGVINLSDPTFFDRLKKILLE